jgi:transposase InsO family protein
VHADNLEAAVVETLLNLDDDLDVSEDTIERGCIPGQRKRRPAVSRGTRPQRGPAARNHPLHRPRLAHFATKAQARRVVANWIDGFYNRERRHSYCGGHSPVDFELILAARAAANAQAA